MKRYCGSCRMVESRAAVPDLYAGLVVACRFCGLLEASLAADQRARRIDPGVRTSVAYTNWMMGDYEQAVVTDIEDIQALRNGALWMLGRRERGAGGVHAGSRPTGRAEPTSGTSAPSAWPSRATGRVRRGDAEDARSGFHDPEGLFFCLRSASYVGEQELALEMLERVVDAGFHCPTPIVRDPWLDPLRTEPAFVRALRRAEEGMPPRFAPSLPPAASGCWVWRGSGGAVHDVAAAAALLGACGAEPPSYGRRMDGGARAARSGPGAPRRRAGRHIYVAGGIDAGGVDGRTPTGSTPPPEAGVRSRAFPPPAITCRSPPRAIRCTPSAGTVRAGWTRRHDVGVPPRGDRWAPRAACPSAGARARRLSSADDSWWSAGHGGGNRLLDTTLVYDPWPDRWSAAAPIPTPRDHLAAAVVGDLIRDRRAAARPGSQLRHGGTLRSGRRSVEPVAADADARGGVGAAASARHPRGGRRDLEPGVRRARDPGGATGEWRTAPVLPTGRHGLAVAALGDRLYRHRWRAARRPCPDRSGGDLPRVP